MPASTAHGHDCNICKLARAIESVSAGFDALLNDSSERDMAHAYLREEIDAVVKLRRSFLVRRRLVKAMRCD